LQEARHLEEKLQQEEGLQEVQRPKMKRWEEERLQEAKKQEAQRQGFGGAQLRRNVGRRPKI